MTGAGSATGLPAGCCTGWPTGLCTGADCCITGRIGWLAFTGWLTRFCCTGFGAAGGGGGVRGMIRAGGNWLTATGLTGTLLATARAGWPVGVISVGRAARPSTEQPCSIADIAIASFLAVAGVAMAVCTGASALAGVGPGTEAGG